MSSWGTLGVVALLLEAAARLSGCAIQTARGGLSAGQWGLLAAGAGLFGYAEGYCVFQKSAARAIVTRARWAARRRDRLVAWIAPLWALGLASDDRRLRFRARAGALAILVAAAVVRLLPAPWRGLFDGAVAPALVWGAAAVLARFARAVGGRPRAGEPDARPSWPVSGRP